MKSVLKIKIWFSDTIKAIEIFKQFRFGHNPTRHDMNYLKDSPLKLTTQHIRLNHSNRIQNDSYNLDTILNFWNKQ